MTKARRRPAMWLHYCPKDRSHLAIQKHRECNWCGATEYSARKTITDTTTVTKDKS